VGRAGRSGDISEAVLFYNNSDISQKPVEPSMGDFVKFEGCRREFLSQYFDAPFEVVVNCCDVCSMDDHYTDHNVPSLQQRLCVKNSIQAYVMSDISGELEFLLSDEKIQTLVDCYEFIKNKSCVEAILKSNVDDSLSDSLLAIFSFYLK
jgi:superfamily II DNA helicase RecQ